MRIIAASTAMLLVTAGFTGLVQAQVRPTDPGEGRSVTIAVVRDRPMPQDIVPRIEDELRQLASPDVEIQFVQTPELDGRWDRAGAREALRAALDNPDVDFILAVGAGQSRSLGGTSREAGHRYVHPTAGLWCHSRTGGQPLGDSELGLHRDTASAGDGSSESS
jgi:hypothetical protein